MPWQNIESPLNGAVTITYVTDYMSVNIKAQPHANQQSLGLCQHTFHIQTLSDHYEKGQLINPILNFNKAAQRFVFVFFSSEFHGFRSILC